DLKFRGLMNQISNLEGLRKEMNKGKISFYCGFDPTADSFHIGHLLPVLVLKRFQEAGHQPIALIGGGTGLIGDPSGKKEERMLNPQETVKKWSQGLKTQLEQFLDFKSKDNAALMVNNYDWLGKIKAIDFLRDIGKYFTVSYMLAKESVKTRLESGISFTEFNYMVLQAYDFLNLFEKYDCKLQIGGSDQWGNITAGIDLIKKKTEKEVYGLTVPLVTKTDGVKFGKTETGTIWLDAKKTTPYQFYQFWINTDDRDVVQYLKYFTFLSKQGIEHLEKEVQKNPEKREAQKTLANNITSLVHGNEVATIAEKISQKLFYDNIKGFSEKELQMIFEGAPLSILKNINEVGLVDLLVETKTCLSRRQAREDIQNKIIFINGSLYNDAQQMIKKSDCFFDKYLVIKKGKKSYYFVLWK
ncbi:MAG: tyrosine--tRNA ligase, partial [Candidatus Pacebacteria bacterium]|nr:tyrosine--tRNA ligase [Candidatus Paceibacterota bacterium]